MSTAASLQDLRASGIFVQLVDGRVRYLIDRRLYGADMPDALDRIRSLVERFEERAAIREFDGGLPRAQAERLALEDVLGERRAVS